MPSTSNAITVNASRNVCVRVLETLSSTNATPAGRSATDSRRFILITGRQLLSVPVLPQWPSPARSRACNPDRNHASQLESCETDRTFLRASQNALPGIQSGLSVSSRLRKLEFAGLLNRRPQPSRDGSPWFSESPAPGCRKPYRGSVRSPLTRHLQAKAFHALLAQPVQKANRVLSVTMRCTDYRQTWHRG